MVLRLEGLNFSTAKEALQDLLRAPPLTTLEQELRECLGAEPNSTLLEWPANLDGGLDLVGRGNVALALEPPGLLRRVASLFSVALSPALGPRLLSRAVGIARGRGEGVYEDMHESGGGGNGNTL